MNNQTDAGFWVNFKQQNPNAILCADNNAWYQAVLAQYEANKAQRELLIAEGQIDPRTPEPTHPASVADIEEQF